MLSTHRTVICVALFLEGGQQIPDTIILHPTLKEMSTSTDDGRVRTDGDCFRGRDVRFPRSAIKRIRSFRLLRVFSFFFLSSGLFLLLTTSQTTRSSVSSFVCSSCFSPSSNAQVGKGEKSSLISPEVPSYLLSFFFHFHFVSLSASVAHVRPRSARARNRPFQRRREEGGV